jgi:hypothetical protein
VDPLELRQQQGDLRTRTGERDFGVEAIGGEAVLRLSKLATHVVRVHVVGELGQVDEGDAGNLCDGGVRQQVQ